MKRKMDYSLIQGHPIAEARTQFKSLAIVTPNIVTEPHSCVLLVSDKTYERIVFAYRLLSQGSMQRVLDGLILSLNKSIQKKNKRNATFIS